jgi:FAD-linked oxidoreductase
MKNWAGNIQFNPEKVFSPQSTNDVQIMIEAANKLNKCIRPIGSGHSWTGLIASNEFFVHLDKMQGIINVDKEASTITAHAGTKLYTFGEEAFKHNLAMANQGDINKQSLAGAMSTGTHGTGVELQSVSNQAREMKLVLASGEVQVINEKETPELFQASRVSFGSLGIMTEATLELLPAYKLKVTTFAEDMDLALQRLSERLNKHRHVEMFYFPVGDWSMVKTMDQTKEEVSHRGLGHKFNDIVLENYLYELLNIIACKTKSYDGIDKIMRKFVSKSSSIDWSHRAFPTARNIRFMEMEYNLPIEKFNDVFEEIKECIKKNNFKTLFPIEIRFVKGDNIWLSPAYGRDSVYFAIHTYIQEEYRPYFNAIEAIFKNHGGRPHWGKWHSLKDQDFEKVYPKWNEFKVLREKLDPKGRFLNEHLKNVFGVN